MKDQTSTHRQITETIVISVILIILLVSAVFLCLKDYQHVNDLLLRNADPAVYSDDGSVLTMHSEMAGKWEYYPDVLLCSEISDIDIKPSYVTVPNHILFSDPELLARCTKASYRAVLHGVEDLGEYNQVLNLRNLSADYRVYINGNLTPRLLFSPSDFQLYPINAVGDVEIVIEIKGANPWMNVVPVFGYVSPSMTECEAFKSSSLLLIAVFLIVFTMFLIFFSSSYDKKMRPVFIYGFLLVLTYIFSSLWAVGYLDHIEKIIPLYLHGTIVFVLTLLSIVFTFFLTRKEFPEWVSKRTLKAEIIMTAASFCLIILSKYFLFWRVLYMAGICTLAAAIVLWIAGLYKITFRSEKSSLLLSVVQICTVMALLMNLMQWNLNRRFSLFYILPGSIGVYLVFCFYRYSQYKKEQVRNIEKLLDTTERLLQAEKLASRTQAALLASQIQPHFLYNTLLTIQNFCRKDPEQASDLIVRFSNYLRHNIDFMNYTELLPFEKELEHIENFMYIQKARFRDDLNYEEQVAFTDFKVPPLTIQPLVENAIKHGICNSTDGGTVLLKVWKTDREIHILVKNDAGPSFSPEQVELRSLSNIQTRLRNLLNASMEIRAGDPEGMEVEIIIPD